MAVAEGVPLVVPLAVPWAVCSRASPWAVDVPIARGRRARGRPRKYADTAAARAAIQECAVRRRANAGAAGRLKHAKQERERVHAIKVRCCLASLCSRSGPMILIAAHPRLECTCHAQAAGGEGLRKYSLLKAKWNRTNYGTHGHAKPLRHASRLQEQAWSDDLIEEVTWSDSLLRQLLHS